MRLLIKMKGRAFGYYDSGFGILGVIKNVL